MAIILDTADIGHFHHYKRFLWICGLESKKEQYLQGEGDSKPLKKIPIFIIVEGLERVQCARMGTRPA